MLTLAGSSRRASLRESPHCPPASEASMFPVANSPDCFEDIVVGREIRSLTAKVPVHGWLPPSRALFEISQHFAHCRRVRCGEDLRGPACEGWQR